MEEHAFRFASQGYACAACGAEEPGTKLGWHTDHAHRGAQNKVRGILCHHCNIGMGMARDNPVWFEQLAILCAEARAMSDATTARLQDQLKATKRLLKVTEARTRLLPFLELMMPDPSDPG